LGEGFSLLLPLPFGRGRTKVGEGFPPILPFPPGGGGYRWGEGERENLRKKDNNQTNTKVAKVVSK